MIGGRKLANLKVRTALLAVLLVIMLVSFFIVWQGHVRQRSSIFQSLEAELQGKYSMMLGVYADMADSIYHLHINVPPVLDILSQSAENPDSADQDAERERLYRELDSLYRRLLQYNFRQLHFHEADNTSFLRFNRPDKFGDDLTGYRSSVEYVNRHHAYIAGFEEGRIFNGFRFVYPLARDNRHLGSVEISVSMRTLIDQMERLFGRSAQFILSADVVYEKVFVDELDNYEPWVLDDRFMLDRAVSEGCILEKRPDDWSVVRIQDALGEHGDGEHPFSTVIRMDGERAVLSFIPVLNIDGRVVGWFLSAGPYDDVRWENREFLVLSLAFLLLVSLLVAFSGYYFITQRQIEHMATFDLLTQCYTRAVLMDRIVREDDRFERYGTAYSLIMLDIDHFKRVNDRFGHQTGDAVLEGIASVVRLSTRKTDVVGRYGGEEFLVLLPETPLEQAVDVAEKLRLRIDGKLFDTVGAVRISCGVSQRTDRFETADDLIADVDAKLYKAKESGRNRVVS